VTGAHLFGPHVTDGDGPVEIEDPLSHLIQLIAVFLIACCQGVEERLQAILTPIPPLLQGRSHPRPHPVAKRQRVVQLLSQQRPFRLLSFYPIHGRVRAYGIDRIR